VTYWVTALFFQSLQVVLFFASQNMLCVWFFVVLLGVVLLGVAFSHIKQSRTGYKKVNTFKKKKKNEEKILFRNSSHESHLKFKKSEIPTS
jgi:hypothetical protein